MNNIELFESRVHALDAAWAKRQAVIEKYAPKGFRVANTGDIPRYYCTHTVGEEEAAKHKRSPFSWALSNHPDLALLPEFDPGEVVIVIAEGRTHSGKYGLVHSYVVDKWDGDGYRILDAVNVDFGSGIVGYPCSALTKAEIPKPVMDFLMAKFEKGGLRNRVHEKVDEAFGADKEV